MLQVFDLLMLLLFTYCGVIGVLTVFTAVKVAIKTFTGERGGIFDEDE